MPSGVIMAGRALHRPNVARAGRPGYATGVSDKRPATPPAGDHEFPTPTGRTPDDLAHWVALNAVRGVSSGAVWALRRAFDSMEQAWGASAGELRRAGLESKVVEQLLDARRDIEPEAALAALEETGGCAIAWDDPAYPARLREIADPPALLHVRGDAEALATDRAVAIVGTRRMSTYARLVTERLAGDLAGSGITIVSGMASGVDSVAHRAALDAGGPTIAVWGTGLGTVYPAANRSLARQIAEQGAIVTEFPVWMRGSAENFPQRNRIISGLVLGTIVVEAPLPSGALITARYAIEHNREIMAVPGDIFRNGSQGTNALIFRGEARAVTSAADVLETLGISVDPVQLALHPVVEPDADERPIADQLNASPKHIDAMAETAKLPAHRVSAILTMLELKGLARHVGGGRYVHPRPEPAGGSGG